MHKSKERKTWRDVKRRGGTTPKDFSSCHPSHILLTRTLVYAESSVPSSWAKHIALAYYSSKGVGISKNSLSWRQHTTVLPVGLVLHNSLVPQIFFWGCAILSNLSSRTMRRDMRKQSLFFLLLIPSKLSILFHFLRSRTHGTSLDLLCAGGSDTDPNCIIGGARHGRLRAVDDANDESDRRWSCRKKKSRKGGTNRDINYFSGKKYDLIG